MFGKVAIFLFVNNGVHGILLNVDMEHDAKVFHYLNYAAGH